MTDKENEIPVFPDITPSKITEIISHEITADQISTEEDFSLWIRRMFEFPERHYFYFQEKDGPRNELLVAKYRAGLILFVETEFFYYKHPNPDRPGFLHIERQGDHYEYEWERKIAEDSPMFMRTTLGLPERTRRELEIKERLKLEDEFRRRRLASIDYDVFVSYASADKDEALQIRDAIVSSNGRVFMAPKDLTPGEDFAEEIRIALKNSQELWLLVSPSSLKSEWVLSEWGAAWALEKRIIPILLRCEPDNLPDRLSRRQCIDFHRLGDLVSQTFPQAGQESSNPRRWVLEQVFTPSEEDRLVELDQFMEWPAHRDPKQGFVYPEPKSGKMWLVYCESYDSDDSDATLKKRRMVLIHITDPKVKRPDDTL